MYHLNKKHVFCGKINYMIEFNQDFIEKAKARQRLFYCLSTPQSTPYQVFDFIQQQLPFTVTQEDVNNHVSKKAKSPIFTNLVKMGLLKESSIKGSFQKAEKRAGAGIKKYYAVDTEGVERITKFMSIEY
jgi:hypothetical protein